MKYLIILTFIFMPSIIFAQGTMALCIGYHNNAERNSFMLEISPPSQMQPAYLVRIESQDSLQTLLQVKLPQNQTIVTKGNQVSLNYTAPNNDQESFNFSFDKTTKKSGSITSTLGEDHPLNQLNGVTDLDCVVYF